MKKIILTTVAFALIAIYANGQNLNIQWGNVLLCNMTSNDIEMGEIKADNSGNLIVIGNFRGTVDFDASASVQNLTSVGPNTNVFVLKVDSAGNFLWVIKIGNTSYTEFRDINIDANNNIYFVVNLQGTIDVDPCASIVNVSAPGVSSHDIILKIDPNGNYKTHLNFSNGAPNSNTYLRFHMTSFSQAIIHTSTGVTLDFDLGPGTFIPAAGVPVIITYDTVMNFQSGVEAPYVEVLLIESDNNGNLYLGGPYNSDTIDFNFGTGVANLVKFRPIGNYFLLKTDSAYNFQWVTGFTGNQNTNYDMKISPDGSVYCGGNFEDTLFVRYNMSSPYLLAPPLTDNAFIIKWNSNGQYEQSFKVPVNNGINDFIINDEQKLYMTGEFSATNVDFNPGAGTALLTGGGLGNIYFAMYDSTLQYLNAYSVGGGNTDSGVALDLDNSGNLLAICGLTNTVDFDVNAGQYNLTSFPNYETYAYIKYNCDPIGNVWPGDANEDLIANNYDLLPIGLHYGGTGPARVSVSNTWDAKFANEWSTTQANGMNKKYVDCNGNGTINMGDTLAINLNYGLSHPFRLAASQTPTSQGSPDLHIVTANNAYAPGSWVDADIWVSDASNPINLYGIGFTINYNTSLVQPGTAVLLYPTSWLGTQGTTAISIGNTAGNAEGAITRINQLYANGFGKIATLRFQAATGISSVTPLIFNFTNHQAYDQIGNLITFNLIPDTILIDPALGINEHTNNSLIEISPNPTSSTASINFTSTPTSNATILLHDIFGRKVIAQKINVVAGANTFTIDVSKFASGVYTMQVVNGATRYFGKVVVQ